MSPRHHGENDFGINIEGHWLIDRQNKYSFWTNEFHQQCEARRGKEITSESSCRASGNANNLVTCRNANVPERSREDRNERRSDRTDSDGSTETTRSVHWEIHRWKRKHMIEEAFSNVDSLTATIRSPRCALLWSERRSIDFRGDNFPNKFLLELFPKVYVTPLICFDRHQLGIVGWLDANICSEQIERAERNRINSSVESMKLDQFVQCPARRNEMSKMKKQIKRISFLVDRVYLHLTLTNVCRDRENKFHRSRRTVRLWKARRMASFEGAMCSTWSDKCTNPSIVAHWSCRRNDSLKVVDWTFD